MTGRAAAALGAALLVGCSAAPESGLSGLPEAGRSLTAEGGARSQFTRAVWSPAGPYLAYQRTSSGVHQPYRWPIIVLGDQLIEEGDSTSAAATRLR